MSAGFIYSSLLLLFPFVNGSLFFVFLFFLGSSSIHSLFVFVLRPFLHSFLLYLFIYFLPILLFLSLLSCVLLVSELFNSANTGLLYLVPYE